jgi:3-hydroxyacyl-[acyl-carrier-protein] dehydratase
VITIAQLRQALPHRYPMMLVDRVTELVPGERLTALKAVTSNEPWYRDFGAGQTDEQYAYPQVLLMESWAQSAGVLATWDQPNPDVLDGRVMLFGGATNVEFHRPVFPGDVVEHHVRLFRALSDTLIFEGESRVAGEPVLSVERMVMAFRPADELTDV